jgi:hypothetical protein
MGGGNPITKAVKAVTKVVKSAVKAVTKVVSGIVSAVTSPFGMNIDVPDYDIGQDQTQAIQGVLLNKDSAIANIPIVYGERQIGGIRVFVSTSGTDNKYLYVAFVLCEGQVNAFRKLYIDDAEVPLSSYAHNVQSTPSSGNYKNKMTVQFFDGRDNQTVSTLLQGAPGWTSNHRLQGLSYLAFRFEWAGFNTEENPDNNPYSGGVPNIRVQIQGRKIFDANTLTTGVDHTTTYANETVTYTNNPVSVSKANNTNATDVWLPMWIHKQTINPMKWFIPQKVPQMTLAYLTADNGIRLEKRITLPTIANRSIAEQFAQVFVKRSRAQKFVTFNTTLATANTAVGDLIRVQSTTLGLDGIFRIMDMCHSGHGH